MVDWRVMMFHLIFPPFVEGNVHKDLSFELVDFLSKEKLPYSFDKIIFYKRKGKGYYNLDEWMLHNINSIKNVIQKLESGDTIIFGDFWNPSVQHLWFHCKLNGLDVKFIGWFHGSTYLEHDFLNKEGFFNTNIKAVKYAENSWFSMYDQIWCSSNYFLGGIPIEYHSKVLFVYEPFYSDKYIPYRESVKEWDIIYPFRLDKDKVDLALLWYVIRNLPTRKFLITSPSVIPDGLKEIALKTSNVEIIEKCDDELHIKTMAKSKIIFSTAFQEGWGYSVLKGVSLGCIPVLPKRAIYIEMYKDKYLYKNEKDALDKLNRFLFRYSTESLPKMPIKFSFDDYKFVNGLLEKKEFNDYYIKKIG